MAYPIILVNSATGSDSAASGAGPATAVTGTAMWTRNAAGERRLGFFETNPDLSGVATDGSHAIYMAISTAGARNFSSITSVYSGGNYDFSVSLAGDMTAASAVLTVADSSVYTVGDIISVAGAGVAGATLYTTVQEITDATHVTLDTAASTNVSGAVVKIPRQVGLATAQGVQVTAATSWAIGGKRASLLADSNSRKLVENNSGSGDLMPGWIARLESGHSETHSATVTLRRAGDTTGGPIIIEGVSGAATRPIITFSNNGNALLVNNVNGWVIRRLELRNSNATKTASVAIIGSGTASFNIYDVKVAHSSDKFWKAVSGGACILWMSEIGFCANTGVRIQGASIVAYCDIHDNGAEGILDDGTFAAQRVIRGNIIESNTGDGINITHTSSTTTGRVGHLIDGNTIYGNGGDGIDIGSANTQSGTYGGLTIQNNICASNTGYGINFSAASMTQELCEYYNVTLRNNNTYGNTAGHANPAFVDTMNTDNPKADPQFTDAANRDFRIGTNLKAQGFPETYIGTGNPSTIGYMDIGAAQRQEAGGASLIVDGVGGVIT